MPCGKKNCINEYCGVHLFKLRKGSSEPDALFEMLESCVKSKLQLCVMCGREAVRRQIYEARECDQNKIELI